MTADDDFELLGQLVGGYLHQDMDLIADSVPEAIARFAEETDAATRDALKAEFDRFLLRHGSDPETEFRRRYDFDFTPDELGQSVAEFFAMTTAILDDPSAWRRYDQAPQFPSGEAS